MCFTNLIQVTCCPILLVIALFLCLAKCNYDPVIKLCLLLLLLTIFNYHLFTPSNFLSSTHALLRSADHLTTIFYPLVPFLLYTTQFHKSVHSFGLNYKASLCQNLARRQPVTKKRLQMHNTSVLPQKMPYKLYHYITLQHYLKSFKLF